MKAVLILLASFCLAVTVNAQSDPVIASVQQALKDQGFYYGEVTGKKDTDTTAAIRRYQIRNGLQITGDLNAETRKSLGVQGNSPPPPRATPPPVPRATTPPDTSDLRDDAPVRPQVPRSSEDSLRDETTLEEDEPEPSYAPGPRGLSPAVSGIFDGTPYEVAPPDLQRRVVVGAQTLLARRGYYRSVIDGVFGPGTEFALRAYQTRFGLQPSGRLDMETLAALGLLPGQRAPGVTAQPRRGFRRSPAMVAPNGEPIYIPR